MRLNLNQTKKIAAALVAVNANASAFTIADAKALISFAGDAERQLASVLPKKAWKGAQVRRRPPGVSVTSN